jgi:hypothetical protein
MKKFITLILLCFPVCLWAFDFGVSLSQDFGFGGAGDNNDVDYSAALVPYFAVSLGDSGDLYISASAKTVYEYEVFTFVGELQRTELSWRFNNLKIRAGRIPYAAPLDFIVEGLFDGAQILFDTTAGTFYAGSWYTGLLYKKSANITITPEDAISYYTDLDYGDFLNTYFASRRMLMSVGWEHPSLAGMIRAKAAVSGQIDLNDAGTLYNSMYASVKAAVPVKQFIFTTGGCMQMGITGDETGFGAAGELGALWIMPTPFYSQLSLSGRYSSGKTDGIDPFIPITTSPQGNILEAKLSSISAFFLDYILKPHSTFSAGLTASYFIRGDTETYISYPITNPIDNLGLALGGELFGRVIWNPLTDLNLSLGAGIFLPSLGNANSDAEPQWRLELGLILIIY